MHVNGILFIINLKQKSNQPRKSKGDKLISPRWIFFKLCQNVV